MPKDKFYSTESNLDSFEVSWWGGEVTAEPLQQDYPLVVSGIPFDRSGVNRLIKTLRKARDQAFGADE